MLYFNQFAHFEHPLKEAIMFDSFGFTGLQTHDRFTEKEARLFANEIAELSGVSAIELYGSISREGTGNDIDLIIIVDDEVLYQKFVACVKQQIESDNLPDISGVALRRNAVEEIFGVPQFTNLIYQIHMPSPGHRHAHLFLDMFVMPVDWRDRLNELQGNLPHDDPQFMRNIANDAYPIA